MFHIVIYFPGTLCISCLMEALTCSETNSASSTLEFYVIYTAVYYLFSFKIFLYYLGFAIPAIKVLSDYAIFASLLKFFCLLVILNGNHLQSLFDYGFMKYDATALATEFYSCFYGCASPPKSSEADKVSFHLI
jgi:hypothetical protein